MKRAIPTARELFCSPRAVSPLDREEMERLFFSNVRLSNGTFKTTSHRRLDDFNVLISSHLPTKLPLQVMDVAISSGISTAEWYRTLTQHGIDCRMVAGDLTVNAALIGAGPGLNVLVDMDSRPLQFDVCGRAIRTDAGRRERLHFAIPLLWLRLVAALCKRRLRGVHSATRMSSAPSSSGFGITPVQLLSADIRAVEQIQVIEDNILSDVRDEARFDVIRAANILNRVYFGDATLITMLRNLRRRLAPGGLMAICRTLENGVTNGSVFRLEGQWRFILLARLNGGSEIEDLVAGLDA
jgi:hypothetical protein